MLDITDPEAFARALSMRALDGVDTHYQYDPWDAVVNRITRPVDAAKLSVGDVAGLGSCPMSFGVVVSVETVEFLGGWDEVQIELDDCRTGARLNVEDSPGTTWSVIGNVNDVPVGTTVKAVCPECGADRIGEVQNVPSRQEFGMLIREGDGWDVDAMTWGDTESFDAEPEGSFECGKCLTRWPDTTTLARKILEAARD